MSYRVNFAMRGDPTAGLIGMGRPSDETDIVRTPGMADRRRHQPASRRTAIVSPMG